MERVILGQPGKTSHVQWCLLFPPETSPPRWPQHLTAALLSPPSGLTASFPLTLPDAGVSLLLLLSPRLSPGISPPVSAQSLVYFPGGAEALSLPPWVPARASRLSSTTWEVWAAGADKKEERSSARGCLLARVFDS